MRTYDKDLLVYPDNDSSCTVGTAGATVLVRLRQVSVPGAIATTLACICRKYDNDKGCTAQTHGAMSYYDYDKEGLVCKPTTNTCLYTLAMTVVQQGLPELLSFYDYDE